MKKVIFLLVLIPVFIISACNKEEDAVALSYEEQLAIDVNIIENYLSDSSLVAQSTASGLFYTIEEEGVGEYPSEISTVEVEYEGRYLDGTVFDSDTIEVQLSNLNLIQGWREGLQLFRVGSSGKLYIPSGLAYGPLDNHTIPANSVLIFDVSLLSIISE